MVISPNSLAIIAFILHTYVNDTSKPAKPTPKLNAYTGSSAICLDTRFVSSIEILQTKRKFRNLSKHIHVVAVSHGLHVYAYVHCVQVLQHPFTR